MMRFLDQIMLVNEPMLDKKAGIVIAAAVPSAVQADVQIRKYWNALTSTYDTSPPTNIPVGSRVGLSARITNTASVAQNLSLLLRIRHPDGNIAGLTSNYSYPGRAAGWFADATTFATSTQAGVYKGEAFAYVGGVLADSHTGVTITTTVGVLTARINHWYFWDPLTSSWESSAPNVPIGSSIGIQPYAVNMSAVPLTVRLDITITDPSGAKITMSGGPVILEADTQNPKAWAHWNFLWVANKVGGYTVDVTLYDAGTTIYDQKKGIVVAGVTGEEPPPSELSGLEIRQYRRV